MEIMSWASVVVYLGYAIRSRELPFWRENAPGFPMGKPLLGLFLAVLIGLLINPPGRTFLEQIGFMRFIVLMYLLSWALITIWSPEFERRLIKCWVIFIVLTGAYALFQFLTGIDLIRPNAHVVTFQSGVWRATGFFSASLTFAYCLGFSLFAVLLPSRRFLHPAWSVAAFIFGVICVLTSFSRGAWLGFVVAGLVYFVIEQRRFLHWFLGGLVMAVSGLLLLPNGISNRINNLIHLRLDHSELVRFHLWRAFFEIFKDHPIFGVGIFQGDLLLPEYYSRLGIDEIFTSHSHNVLLQWAAGCGLFGLIFYIWVSIGFLYLAWKLRGKTPWGWSLFLAQIFLHVGGLTENNFFDGEVNHFLQFGWAIILALTYLARMKEPVFHVDSK
jgi:O-antigen ligase